jgi:hypothetical protein
MQMMLDEKASARIDDTMGFLDAHAFEPAIRSDSQAMLERIAHSLRVDLCTCSRAACDTSIKLSLRDSKHDLVIIQFIAGTGTPARHAITMLDDGEVLSYGRVFTSLEALATEFGWSKVRTVFIGDMGKYVEFLGDVRKSANGVSRLPTQPAAKHDHPLTKVEP